jgi:coenzyme F420-reducing hydrogenase delta subunit
VSGNLRVQDRIEKLKVKLADEGIDPARLRLEWISAMEGKNFQQVIQEMAEKIAEGKANREEGEKG